MSWPPCAWSCIARGSCRRGAAPACWTPSSSGPAWTPRSRAATRPPGQASMRLVSLCLERGAARHHHLPRSGPEPSAGTGGALMILLFTTVLVVPLLAIFAGLAIDLAAYGVLRDKLQRAADSAA